MPAHPAIKQARLRRQSFVMDTGSDEALLPVAGAGVNLHLYSLINSSRSHFDSQYLAPYLLLYVRPATDCGYHVLAVGTGDFLSCCSDVMCFGDDPGKCTSVLSVSYI